MLYVHPVLEADKTATFNVRRPPLLVTNDDQSGQNTTELGTQTSVGN